MRSWFTLDRVTAMEPGKGAQALLNVPSTLSFLSTHFPRFPVLPGVLILDSLVELSAQLLEKQTGHQWRLGKAEQIRFRHFVQPGDQMEIAVELKELSTESALLTGKIQVEGQVVTTAQQIRLIPFGKGVVK